jgi:hypothetical protein
MLAVFIRIAMRRFMRRIAISAQGALPCSSEMMLKF